MENGWGIRGRTAFITGAAGGIGSELARQLAALGANVLLVDVDREGLERLVSEVGDQALGRECDVTDPEELERAISAGLDRFSGLDVVVANAALADVASVESVDPAAFERVVAVNFLGVWRTVRAALPHVLSRRGYVLVVSSLAGHVQGPLHASYNASKAAIQAFANTVRLEVQGRGVDVGVAHLGYTDTERGRWAVEHPAMKQLRGLRIPRPLPVSETTASLVRAIDRRARRVVVPRWARIALVAPDLLQRRLEAVARRRGWAAIIGGKAEG